MREIKFNFWVKSIKEIWRWERVKMEHPFQIFFLDEDFIPLQYTGLKDKNGKEIYEGDVFKFHPSKEWKGTEPDNPCFVFWADSLSAFMFYVGTPEMSTLLPPSESIEIIGNVHENPELLREVKK